MAHDSAIATAIGAVRSRLTEREVAELDDILEAACAEEEQMMESLLRRHLAVVSMVSV